MSTDDITDDSYLCPAASRRRANALAAARADRLRKAVAERERIAAEEHRAKLAAEALERERLAREAADRQERLIAASVAAPKRLRAVLDYQRRRQCGPAR